MMQLTSGYKMNVTKYVLQDGLSVVDSATRLRKMQIIRTGTFSDPRYGIFEITPSMLQEMVKNFSEGVRGVIPALDYKHESDDVAAGWFKKLYLSEDGQELWAEIEMTPKGEKVLSDKEFGYVSADLDTAYTDNETHKEFGCVLLGAGLTNRPVIKRMEPVIQLSEKPKDVVGEKIKKLIAEGKPQDQAVAIALEMQRQGKLSEGEGMSEEEKKMMADMQKQLEGYKKCADEMKCADPEALMQAIMDMKKKMPEEKAPEAASAEQEKPEVEVEMKELEEAKKELAEVKAKLSLSEKTKEFETLMTEGKAVEAQRESFLKGDMKEFIAKAQPIKLAEQGHGGEGAANVKNAADAEEQILEKAKKLSEEKKISMKEAISEVLKTNKQLAEKIR